VHPDGRDRRKNGRLIRGTRNCLDPGQLALDDASGEALDGAPTPSGVSPAHGELKS
jgi:hypothetical protein